ncbi:hypothetical protein PENTCL1PPCAC_2884, partial [Pristionchus entomophagus]
SQSKGREGRGHRERARIVQESLWIESLRVREEIGVVMDCPNVWHDICSLGEIETEEGGGSGGTEGNIPWQDIGQSLQFSDHRRAIGKGGTIG